MSVEEITQTLRGLVDNPEMMTESVYSPLAVDYPDNRLPFVDFHLLYLTNHKNVNPEHYISNLRLMITKR
jgi:hypothetical protein